MYRSFIFVVAAIIGVGLLVPSSAFAAGSSTELSTGAWIPYWASREGAADAQKHLSTIDVIYPFAYAVKLDGSLMDMANLDASYWKSLFRNAQKKHVEIIPTVMMSDGNQIQNILTNNDLRAKHIANIADMVKDGKFDGVDIDYEGKKSSTSLFFSLFLAQLKQAIGDKTLVCTIEPRTPPESLYTVIPNPLQYANDYAMLNNFCDRIQIMAYDQQRADIKLNAARIGTPYVPVADPEWVDKVIALALKSFPKDKVVLGVPTYGYNYDIGVVPEWYRDYSRVGAINIPDAKELAHEYHVTPSRDSAGEMAITYIHASSSQQIPKNYPVPKGTPSGMKVAAQALAYANKTGNAVLFRFVAWNDATAIKQKIDLAKKYGLSGVALFKVDGLEDQAAWKYLK